MACKLDNPTGCFQSIGVTKDWRRILCDGSRTPATEGFPINRRHQGLATGLLREVSNLEKLQSFQSIGVTKDWRLPIKMPESVLVQFVVSNQ